MSPAGAAACLFAASLPAFTPEAVAPRLESRCIYDARPDHRQVHIATVIEGHRGTWVLAFVDYAPRGGKFAPDMDPSDTIRLMRSTDGGRHWTAPERFDSSYSLNPGFVRGPSGDLWLFFDRRTSAAQDDNNLLYAHSQDDGRSWTPARPVSVGERVHLLANNGIALPDGDLVIPYYYDRGNRNLPFAFARQDFASGVLILTRGASEWKSYGEVVVRNREGQPNIRSCAVEPTILLGPDRVLRLLLRTKAGAIYEADSGDEGRTWSDAWPLPFSNPNTKSAALTLRDGRAVLVWNNTQVFDAAAKRFPLMASLSEDGGRTWPFTITLADDRVPLSYPTLIEGRGEIVVIHDRDYAELRQIRLTEGDLRHRWTAINRAEAWRVEAGVAAMGDDRPFAGGQFPWTAWSKLATFPEDKPQAYELTADVCWQGGAAETAASAIGLFNGYQDEDNWCAWVCEPVAGRAGWQRIEHFGASDAAAHYWDAERTAWRPLRVMPGVWYRVTLRQAAAAAAWDIRDAASGRLIGGGSAPIASFGHFWAVGTLNAKASFRGLRLRPLPAATGRPGRSGP